MTGDRCTNLVPEPSATEDVPSTDPSYNPICDTYPQSCFPLSDSNLPFGPVNANKIGVEIYRNEDDLIVYVINLLQNGRVLNQSYELRFLDVVETDQNGVVVCNNFALWDTKVVSGSDSQSDGSVVRSVNMTTKLSNCAEVSILGQLYDSPSAFLYGGQVVNVSSNTYKFSVDVKNWPWLSPTNRLRVKVGVKTNVRVLDHNLEFDPTTSNLKNIMVNIDDGSKWNFRFLEYALSDDVPQLCKVKLFPLSIKPYLDVIVDYDFSHFEKHLFYDPDFSVLFPKNPGNENEEDELEGSSSNSSKSDKAMPIIVGVCVAVAVVAALAGAAVMYLKKKREDKEVDAVFAQVAESDM